MVADVRVDADQLVALSRRLKAAGDVAARRDFSRDLTTLARKQVIPELREAMRDGYPRRGGLAEQSAKAKMTASLRTGNKSGGLVIRVKGLEIKLGESYGKFRHPVFADKSKTRREWRWVDQIAPLGLLRTTARRSITVLSPEMSAIYRKHVEKALAARSVHGG